MNILAISGSARALSTNTALLRAIAAAAPRGFAIDVFDGIGALPVFSPDLELPRPPDVARDFIACVAAADALLISSPEYVRTLPGGLKNAIDWLVSGEEVIHKPVALVHASHRGDDMLEVLRIVLGTVSTRFTTEPFLRIPVTKKSPEEIAAIVAALPTRRQVKDFLDRFARHCGAVPA